MRRAYYKTEIAAILKFNFLFSGLAWMWSPSSTWTTRPTSTRRREMQRGKGGKRRKRWRISMWTTVCTASSGRYRISSGKSVKDAFLNIFDCSRNPAQCYQKVPWKQFSMYAVDVLSTFQVSITLNFEHMNIWRYGNQTNIRKNCRVSNWTQQVGRVL